MEVKLNGFILSSILYDQFNSSSDTEGFLIGESFKISSAVIDDFSSNTKEQKIIYVVKNIVCCWGLGSWYNNTCDLDTEELNKILGNHKNNVIGWFKTRKHTSQVASFKEKTLHSNLQNFYNPPKSSLIDSDINSLLHSYLASETSLKPSAKLPFIFLLHTTSNPYSNPVSSFNFQFSSMNSGGELKALEMKVNNLSLTSPVEYREGDSTLQNPHVLSMFNNSDAFFRDREDVNKIIDISSELLSKISNVEVELMESENELDSEFTELMELRRKLQKAKKKAAQQNEELIASQKETLKEQNTTKDVHKITSEILIKPSSTKAILPTQKSEICLPVNVDNVSHQKPLSDLPKLSTVNHSSSSNAKTYQLMTFEDDDDIPADKPPQQSFPDTKYQYQSNV